MRRIRRHVTFANVASAIALFVALGGGTAIALNGSNTVQSDDLGPGAQVKAPDVADNAVNSADIVNGSIASGDLAPAARGARAYGLVTAGGQLSRSKNVASVSNPANGVYCITLASGIDPHTAVLIAQPDSSNNITNANLERHEVAESVSATFAPCTTQQLQVDTFVHFSDATDNDNGGGNTSGDDLVVSSQGFSFVVP